MSDDWTDFTAGELLTADLLNGALRAVQADADAAETTATAAQTAAATAQTTATAAQAAATAATGAVITTSGVFHVPGDFASVAAAMAYLSTVAIAAGAIVTLQLAAQRTSFSLNLNNGFEAANFSQVNIAGATPVTFNITSGPTTAEDATGFDGSAGAWTATYGLSTNPTAAGIEVGDFVTYSSGTISDPLMPQNCGCWQVTAITTNSVTLELTHAAEPYAAAAAGAVMTWNPTQLSFPTGNGININGGKLGSVSNLALIGPSSSGYGIYITNGGYLAANEIQNSMTPSLCIVGFAPCGLFCVDSESDASFVASSISRGQGVWGQQSRMTGVWICNGNAGGSEFENCWVRSPWFVAVGSVYGSIDCFGISDVSAPGGLIGGNPGGYPAAFGTGAGNICVPTTFASESDVTSPPVGTVGNGNVYICKAS